MTTKQALLKAIEGLDEAGAEAIYRAISNHIEREETRLELLGPEDGAELKPDLATCQKVVGECDRAAWPLPVPEPASPSPKDPQASCAAGCACPSWETD